MIRHLGYAMLVEVRLDKSSERKVDAQRWP